MINIRSAGRAEIIKKHIIIITARTTVANYTYVYTSEYIFIYIYINRKKRYIYIYMI